MQPLHFNLSGILCHHLVIISIMLSIGVFSLFQAHVDFCFCINNSFLFLVSDNGFEKLKKRLVWVLSQDYVVTDVY